MRKLIKIFNVCLVLLIVMTGCTARHASNEGYLLYRSSPVGLEIEYPDFWEVTDDKTERTVAFAAPNEGFADNFRENVTIICEEIGQTDIAFDDYVLGYIDQLPSAINKFNKISEEETTVGQYRAYNIVYEGTTNNGELRLSHTFISSGKYVYIYTFMAEPASYEYYSQNAEVMLKTFVALKQ